MKFYASICSFLTISLLVLNVRADDVRLQHHRENPDAVLITITDGTIEVQPVDWPLSSAENRQQGLVVWTGNGRDRWGHLPLPKALLAGGNAEFGNNDVLLRIRAQTRGEENASATGVAMITAQPDQLLGRLVFRGKGLLTPAHQGRNLNPQITIRRLPNSEDPRFPAEEFTLSQQPGGEVILRVRFAAGQATLPWTGIPELPENLTEGLSPGAYSLRGSDSGTVVNFEVVKPKVGHHVTQPAQQLAELLEAEHHPLYLQVLMQRLVDPTNQQGGAEGPFLSDALDQLESAPDDAMTPWLQQMRKAIRRRLKGNDTTTPVAATVGETTGIEPVDRAREHIATSQWEEGEKALAQAHEEGPRARALSTLYNAVILAESGPATGESAEAMFLQAVEELKEFRPTDSFRARMNYGNFLLNRGRDALHNHAFQMAAGVESPLMHALNDWRGAQQQYQKAFEIAQDLPPQQLASVQVNQAGLYAFLADVIRVLDAPADGQRQFVEGENIAWNKVGRLAGTVVDSADAEADVATRAVAHEILAQAAFRQRHADVCRKHAAQAKRLYQQTGSLAGAESVHRLLGLLHLQQEKSEAESADPAEVHGEALRHLQIAQLLSEVMRQHISLEQAGRSRAGFLARRTYVNEQIIGLLNDQEDFTEALRYAELAKARALQDVLATSGATANANLPAHRTVETILADWPSDTVALEYFLGSERAWVFLISQSGDVQAWQLQDENTDLQPRQLIADISQFLRDMRGKSRQLRMQALSGRGFEKGWQDQLNDFYQQLLPGPVRAEIADADNLVIIPHHVLHYFPFAALVTAKDEAERGRFELPMPRFLVDEVPSICRAPSLTSWDLLRERTTEPIRTVQGVGIVDFAAAPSLEGVEKDMQALRNIFADRVQEMVEGDNADERRVKNLLRRRGMLFTATHGMNVAHRPLSSYLLCHADDENDGRLTAAEIFSGEIGADLIVMSACFSGLAERSPMPGDDLFGLERAFLHSGSSAVVSGLWDVYDGTGPILMNKFFRELAAGQPAAAALAESQRTFLKQRRAEGPGDPWIHPYFWAVYAATGDNMLRLASGRTQ